MATGIPYCDETWNPVIGCTKIASGCQNCWAERLHTQRYKAYYNDKNVPDQYSVPFSRIQLLNHRLTDPLHWRKPRTIFVNSMSDTLHKDVPWGFIDKIIATAILTPRHTYQLFTKRYQRANDYFSHRLFTESGNECICEAIEDIDDHADPCDWNIPPANIHLLFSVSTQKELDEAVPILFEIPTAQRGVSIEPCLGPIDFYGVFDRVWMPDIVIVGCESGPNRRPCKLEWVRSIVEQCEEGGVCCYVKQLNIDGKVVTDPAKFPEEMRIREYPG